MRVEAITQSICDLALEFGEGGKKERRMSRPYGVALLIAGFDDKGPQLFFSDPSGTYLQYKAKSIGSGSENAQTTLQEKYRDDLTLAEAEQLAIDILRQVMEEKVSQTNVEMASVTSNVSIYYHPLLPFPVLYFACISHLSVYLYLN